MTNYIYTETPFAIADSGLPAQTLIDTGFGMEFPGLLDPPPIGDQGLVTDPVTSGGDSATYERRDTENEDN